MDEGPITGTEIRAPSLPVALSIPLLAGAAVAVIAGAYGRVHDPTGENIVDLFFSSTATTKAWLATLAVALASTRPRSKPS